MIIFYFPSHGKGGTQSLFISILELLSDYSINTGFVDYQKVLLRLIFYNFQDAIFLFFLIMKNFSGHQER